MQKLVKKLDFNTYRNIATNVINNMAYRISLDNPSMTDAQLEWIKDRMRAVVIRMRMELNQNGYIYCYDPDPKIDMPTELK